MQASSLRRWALAPALVVATAVALALALIATPASGDAHVTYTVTIENLTAGQPFTPPVVVTHSSDLDVFETGQSASAEILAIAENGNNDPLVALIGSSSAVIDSAVGTAAVLPGETATLSVTAPAGSLISAAMMLICTNDGFTGIDSLALPATGSTTIDADAYDAGTETNTEDFADIVPPCQGLIGVSSDDEGTGESNSARKKRVQTCGRSPSAIPSPVSRTCSRSQPSSATILTSMRPPGGVCSMALRIRLPITRSTRVPSTNTFGWSPSASRIRVTSLSPA